MLILAGLVFANVHEAKANPLQPAPEAQKNMFIRFFQDHISAVDGNRCCMTPSCSEYAAQAVKKHGPVIGWIMACDRLVRCGRDEVRVSPHVCINGQEFVSDPVSANDFWWFKKEDKTREFPK
jgi:putative component of membrane protein insertase Oxa1/YidC/SpoIIIJ protein YidD